MTSDRFFTLIAFLSLFMFIHAAPALITRIHTAPTQTVWNTYTTGTTYVTEHQNTVQGAPSTSSTSSTSQTPEAAQNPQLSAAQADTQASGQSQAPAPAQSSTEAPSSAPASSAPASSAPTFSSSSSAPNQNGPSSEVSSTQSTTSANENGSPSSSTSPAWSPSTVLTATSSSWSSSSSSTSSTPSSSSSSPSSSSASSTSTPSSGFEQEILDEHNKKRALHGVQSLSWDSSLAEYAAQYAAKAFSCDNVQLVHSHGPYGENLAVGYDGGAKPVDAWYDEINYYNFNDPGFSEKTGHFTQLVWKSTSKVGCSRVQCNNEWGQYTICEYSDLRGNVIGTDHATGENYFQENVVKPIKSS